MQGNAQQKRKKNTYDFQCQIYIHFQSKAFEHSNYSYSNIKIYKPIHKHMYLNNIKSSRAAFSSKYAM